MNYSALKKNIGIGKFLRVMKNPYSIPCVAARWMKKSYQSEYALEAYKHGGYVYAKFRCKQQDGSVLKTFCVRYSVEHEHRSDFFYFREGGVV